MLNIRCRIHHLVQVDERYCHTLNNTCFAHVVHTDTKVFRIGQPRVGLERKYFRCT